MCRVQHLIYARLSTDAEKAPDARMAHFSNDFSRDYFAGLVSETYNPTKNRFEKRRGARNEPLDTFVYAFAATYHPELRMHRWRLADWDRRAEALARQPVVTRADEISSQPDGNAAPPPPTARPAPRRFGRIGRF